MVTNLACAFLDMQHRITNEWTDVLHYMPHWDCSREKKKCTFVIQRWISLLYNHPHAVIAFCVGCCKNLVLFSVGVKTSFVFRYYGCFSRRKSHHVQSYFHTSLTRTFRYLFPICISFDIFAFSRHIVLSFLCRHFDDFRLASMNGLRI